MDELGDVLDLMAGARDRFRTVRLVLRDRYDADLRRTATARVFGDHEDPDEPLEHGPHERTSRVWLVRGVSIRIETEERYRDTWVGPDDETRRDVVGPEQFLDPRRMLGHVRLTPAGRDTVAGREAVLVRADPRDHDELSELFAAGIGADAYELAIDAERGVVLRSVAYLDGREFQRVEAIEIAFDEELPAELFEEDGEDEEPPEMRQLTLAEAVELVPFTVFAPTQLGPSWTVEVSHQPAHEWTGPEFLRLDVRANGGLWAAGVALSAAGAVWPRDEDLEEWAPLAPGSAIETGRFRAATGPEHPMALVRTERDGTVITISSQSLPEARLLDLLDRLEPV